MKKNLSLQTRIILLFVICLSICMVSEVGASINKVYVRAQKLKPFDSTLTSFGYSVAISGNTAIVGYPDNNEAIVYILDGNKWKSQAKLSDAMNMEQLDSDAKFGSSVAIYGDVAVVGAPFQDDNPNIGEDDKGVAYIFRRTNTSWSAFKLSNPSDSGELDGQNSADFFGNSVAIDVVELNNVSTERIIVGSPNDRVNPPQLSDFGTFARWGSATVFECSNGNCNAGYKIVPMTGYSSGGNGFGESVDISGGRVIIGNSGYRSDQFTPLPRAQTYTGSGTTWTFEYNFNTNVGSDLFGTTVAIDGDSGVIGSPGLQVLDKNMQVVGTGTAFEINLVNGTKTRLTKADASIIGERSGSSVAISGDTIIVGADCLNAFNNEIRGNVKIIKNQELNQTIFQRNYMDQDLFGSSVSIDGEKIVVGARYDSGPGGNAYNTPVDPLGNYGSASIFQKVPTRPFDFNGDGASDASVFRSSTSQWWTLDYYPYAATNDFHTNNGWGLSDDKLAPADFNGDGKTDYAVYRSGTWWISYNKFNSDYSEISLGVSEDLPRPNDFDGDGKADVAVWRPSNGTWYWKKSSDPQYPNSTVYQQQFGANGDIPVLADFDGDGIGEFAVFRQSTGVWYWRTVDGSQTVAFQFGVKGDMPMPGDYDLDGITEAAVYRPSDNVWYVINSVDGDNNGIEYLTYGLPGDIPVAADYNSDGRTDFAIWRPSTGEWYVYEKFVVNNGLTNSIAYSGYGFQWGLSSDTPIPNVYSNPY